MADRPLLVITILLVSAIGVLFLYGALSIYAPSNVASPSALAEGSTFLVQSTHALLALAGMLAGWGYSLLARDVRWLHYTAVALLAFTLVKEALFDALIEGDPFFWAGATDLFVYWIVILGSWLLLVLARPKRFRKSRDPR